MSDELIDKMFFFAALYSFVVLWGYYLVARPREGELIRNIRITRIKKEYSDYCNKTGVANWFLKCAFLLENLPYIHPYIAVLTPMSIIGAFFIFKSMMR